MADMHPSMTRLFEAIALKEGAIQTPSELARLLNTSPQRIKNWQDRGISQQGALDAQAKLGISATYVVEGKGETFLFDAEPAAREPDPSQSERQDWVTIGHAVEVLRRYLAIVGRHPKWVANPELLEMAFMVVNESEDTVTSNNVIDFTERLGRKLREAGGIGDERGAFSRTSNEVG